MAQLNPQAFCFLYVIFYDLEGYLWGKYSNLPPCGNSSQLEVEVEVKL
jgi:hypothetical protein